jgi:hypothetical protein
MNWGYVKILCEVKLPFVFYEKSFRHNTQLIRKILAKWASNFIENQGKKK